MNFDWDPRKATLNLGKHGVSFTEAASAFGDSLSITIPDPDHSDQENRFLLVGRTVAGRLVVVTHVERGRTIRIISARLASRRERRSYEEDQD